jgi:hypothetical protein
MVIVMVVKHHSGTTVQAAVLELVISTVPVVQDALHVPGVAVVLVHVLILVAVIVTQVVLVVLWFAMVLAAMTAIMLAAVVPIIVPVLAELLVYQVAAAVQIIVIQRVELFVWGVLVVQVHVMTGVNQPVSQLAVIHVKLWLLARYTI